MNITIKKLNTIPNNILKQFFYKAIFIPENQPPIPFETIYKPELYRYIDNFGNRKGDIYFVGMVCAEIAGLVWVRCFSEKEPGYGFINEKIPEMCISVKEPYRNLKLGTRLIEKMLVELDKLGYLAVSISVDTRNPAKNLYSSLGFEVVNENEYSVVMIKKFGDTKIDLSKNEK